MIISISGAAGSGKSTIAKMLAENLGWPRYYIGELRRQKAKLMGLTLEEYNKFGENDFNTDFEVDKYQKDLARKEGNFIIEGRTSWHFIPQSLKIYFDVDEKIGAQRIFNDLKKSNKRNEGVLLNNYEDVVRSLKERKRSDMKRYKKYYNIDVFDKNNYDYVIDTTNLSIDEVFQRAYKLIKAAIDPVRNRNF